MKKNSQKCQSVLLTLVAACVLGSSASVSAQVTPPTVPSQCSNSRDKSGWTSGRQSGESRVTSVWKSAAVGQNLDNLSNALPGLLDALSQNLQGLAGGQRAPSQYVRCRAQGYADGFFWRLNQLFGQCVLDGADWAQFAANLYCELSADLGGLEAASLFVRAPVGVCGNLFEATCEDVYRFVGREGDHAINAGVQAYLELHDFVAQPFAGCRQFAEDDFLEVFESALHNDCTYSIAE